MPANMPPSVPPATAFKTPPIVVEPVTERAEVVAPKTSRLVKRPRVEKKLVEVALVVVALLEVRLVIVDEALITDPATCEKALEVTCWRGVRVSKEISFYETDTFKKTLLLSKA